MQVREFDRDKILTFIFYVKQYLLPPAERSCSPVRCTGSRLK